MKIKKEIERIVDGDVLIAVIVPQNASLNGMSFFSKNDDFLQFGINLYEAGMECQPHKHVEREVFVTQTPQEVLHIDYGKIELSVYSKSEKLLATRVLSKGDTVFLVNGGHGLKVIQPTKIIEVKQGPYLGFEKYKILI